MQALRALDERRTHGIQLLRLLLAHRTAQNICLAQRKACQRRGYLHNLLLVENNAIGILKDRLHQRMQHLRRALAVTAGDKVLRHTRAQGTRTVESHERNQILKAFRRQIHNQLRNARRLQLENAGRFAATEHLAGFLIMQRNIVDIHNLACRLLDELDAVTNNRQRAQAEEVHLQQAQLLHLVFVILRNHAAVTALLQRHIVAQIARCDNNTCGMRARVARQALDAARQVDELFNLRT